ncbi:hypothetical protein Plhal304r1_c031g0101581 [Plasmopara halstedii]
MLPQIKYGLEHLVIRSYLTPGSTFRRQLHHFIHAVLQACDRDQRLVTEVERPLIKLTTICWFSKS